MQWVQRVNFLINTLIQHGATNMEMFKSVEDALKKYPNCLITHARVGNCMVCSQRSDLRAGACFECIDLVDGEKIKGGHRLWERDNEKNTWYCGD